MICTKERGPSAPPAFPQPSERTPGSLRARIGSIQADRARGLEFEVIAAKRLLGRAGVEFTQLGFGGAGIGDLFEVVSEAEAEATLKSG